MQKTSIRKQVLGCVLIYVNLSVVVFHTYITIMYTIFTTHMYTQESIIK